MDATVVSQAWLRAAGLALALTGATIAGYLTSTYYADAEPVCVGGGESCARVQSSAYADLAGVPVALIGVAGYILLAGAFALRGPRAALAAAFVGLVGFGFSLYLTYVELFVIDAICQWCVATAVVMTAVAAIAVARYAGGYD